MKSYGVSNLGHNTSDPSITIHYPFHPLAGQRFLPVLVRTAPEAAYVIQLPEHRLTVPAWMTEERAASARLATTPCVAVAALLRIHAVLELASREEGTSAGSMGEEPAVVEGHPHGGHTATAAPVGATRTRRAPARGRRTDGPRRRRSAAADPEDRTRGRRPRRGRQGGRGR